PPPSMMDMPALGALRSRRPVRTACRPGPVTRRGRSHSTMEHSAQSPRAGEQGPAPDLTGRTLGDFLVLRRLGQGGMGQVYLAQQLSLKRKVALKLLRPDLAANPTSLQRFKMEAEAVARVTHANIVQVYAIGEYQGIHYMALEYVEGRNLKE